MTTTKKIGKTKLQLLKNFQPNNDMKFINVKKKKYIKK